MTREELEILLKSNSNIHELKTPKDEGTHFDRVFSFRVDDVFYKIEWWCNQMTLYIGDVIIPFSHVEVSSTYPNRSSANLQFDYHKSKSRYEPADTTCIIPLEKYND